MGSYKGYITYRYQIEADSLEEAYEKMYTGQGEEVDYSSEVQEDDE